MSKYFKDFDFELPEDKGKPKPKPQTTINKDKLNEVIEEIKVEFERIKTGHSEFTTYAINPGNFGSPVGNAFKGLIGTPSLDAMRGFIQLAEQDLGVRAATHFKKLLATTLEVPTNE